MAPKSLKSFDDIFGDKPEGVEEKIVVNNEPQMLPIEHLKPYAKKRFALYSGRTLKRYDRKRSPRMGFSNQLLHGV